MDSMALIAAVSIFTAGLTIASDRSARRSAKGAQRRRRSAQSRSNRTKATGSHARFS